MSEALAAKIEAAEAEMRRRLREVLGSPTEQHERLERTIEALGAPMTGIDRSGCPWWRATK